MNFVSSHTPDGISIIKLITMLRKLSYFLSLFFVFFANNLYLVSGSAQAQENPAPTGTLVISITSALEGPLKDINVSYSQVTHDFLFGYSGPAINTGWPEAPFGLSLDLRCIPWVEIEPRDGFFPHQAEETDLGSSDFGPPVIGNDCLLYFGADASNELPSGLDDLSFEDFLVRTQRYLEHAVRFQSANGFTLFVIKEPGYPSSNLLGFTASQWLRLVKLTCQVIHQINPHATIVIEVIPQYLPSQGYTPYTFLDTLIRDGVSFDGIMLVFSPPITARFSSTGYPEVKWVGSQVNVFSDLGKRLIVRFSGVTVIKSEASRQIWLNEMYDALFSKQTVIGIYWDEINHYPVKLTSAKWPAGTLEAAPSSRSAESILGFISSRTSSGEEQTDANGQVVIEAFAGEYDIRIDGIIETTRTHIYRGEERRMALSLPGAEATRSPVGENGLDQKGVLSRDGGKLSTATTIGWIFTAVLILGLGLYYWLKRKSKQ